MAHVNDNTGAAQAAPFDAARWFADWSDNGGVVIVTGERLFVSRIAAIDCRAAQRLDTLRAQIMHPEAAQALAGLLRAKSGEVDA
ncbi:hypothetical protein [Sphingomonas sp.]|uniref:hypothetical protein n=1 Tax=Sphingomonas sp. TaxID=28214 RepID=UPI003BA85FC8